METKIKKLKPLAGMTLQELREVTASLGMPKFVATQLSEWIYSKRVTSFEEMRNISKANKELLSQKYCVGLYGPQSSQTSSDGTVKYLFDAGNNKSIMNRIL